MTRGALPRRMLVVALLAGGALSAFAQSYTVVGSFRIPLESFVGDTIELRYTIRSEAVVRAPETLPVPTWGSIESIVVTPVADQYDVRFLVVPFEPGTLAMPRMQLGGIEVDGLSFVVTSVLDADTAIVPVYGPQQLPGTRAALTLLLLAFALSATLAVFVAGRGGRRIAAAIARLRVVRPFRRIAREFARLEHEHARLSAREFYTAVVELLREYMSAGLGFDCRSATSTELISYLPALASMAGATAATGLPLSEVLRAADGAKFAGSAVRPKARLQHLTLCIEVLAQLDALRRRPRPPRRERRTSRAGS